MDFYKALKYGMMVLFIIVIGVAVISSDDSSSAPQPVPQTSKFNF